MDSTTLGLKKPLTAEAYDIQIFNDNADKTNELILADREQINSLDANKANKAQEAWITATLQNGWTGTLQYAKNELGFVTVKGYITSGTVGNTTVITTLPTLYKPTVAVPVLVMTSSQPSTKDGMIFNAAGSLVVGAGAELVTATAYIVNFCFYAG